MSCGNRSLALVLILIASTAFAQTPNNNAGARSMIEDRAEMFSAEAVAKAKALLIDSEHATDVVTILETLNGREARALDAIAAEKARSARAEVVILIDKKDRGFELYVVDGARAALNREQREQVRDAFLAAFREKDFDKGLLEGTNHLVLLLRSARMIGKLALQARSEGSPVIVRNQVRLTLEGARQIIAGAEKQATELKLKMNIAVVDDGGHLLAFARMDGARPASGYTAITKATTAATFRQDTGPIPKGTTAPDPLLNLSLQNAAAVSGGKVTTLLGGIAVTVDGQVIGGVGVGGGSGEQDAEVARAGVARFLKALEVKPEESKGLRSVPVSAAAALAVGAAEQRPVPHGQDAAPNEPLSPSEAIKKMTVPAGFTVELVASEPDLVNPVAMTFDDRGRVWVTESLEYPRREAGPGRDRVKILEDTDGDGTADKFSVFAEGLNIPSGIAVGHGGVWVANSPDLLFLQDTDGDGKADRREVVVTGFGRSDTHELPNTLAWGPDGWLYGWNGVFNPSKISYRGKTYEFTCAIFRIHPRTRDFELFCEGTSNPWGLTWDREGSAFASACVIDHLWHLTETGYYLRQGGPYPPFTWKIESIVEHNHQKAAYCGIHFYDSDTYPAAYRGKLFMGNIHGGAVNVDSLSRRGSTYRGKSEPYFIKANDAWFMPVSQKTGPDGCLYVLDWYDRYHCYQDANRDPAGIDRLKGRLYRIRYLYAPRRTGFDLAQMSGPELVALLDSPNSFDRDAARRLLHERSSEMDKELRALAFDSIAARRTRMNAVWTLVSRGVKDSAWLLALMNDPDPGFRAWGVRAAGNAKNVEGDVRAKITILSADPSADVRLQVAIAARKVVGLDAPTVLMTVASSSGNDPLIMPIVWQNLQPLLDHEANRRQIVATLEGSRSRTSKGLTTLAAHAFEKMLTIKPMDWKVVAGLLDHLIVSRDGEAIREALDALSSRLSAGANDPNVLSLRKRELAPVLLRALDRDDADKFADDYSMLLAYCGDSHGRDAALALFRDGKVDELVRLRAFSVVADVFLAGETLKYVERVFEDPKRAGSVKFRGQLLSALGRLDDPEIAEFVLKAYSRIEPELQPRAIELLTQRVAWGRALMEAVGKSVVPASAVNVNQIRRLLNSKDATLAGLVKERWGTVRDTRNPAREQVIRDVRARLRKMPGDAPAGCEGVSESLRSVPQDLRRRAGGRARDHAQRARIV